MRKPCIFNIHFKMLPRRKTQIAAGLVGLALNLGLANSAFAEVCPNVPDVSIYLLDTNNTLYVLPPGAQVFEKAGQVNGLASENLVGIDFRPADGFMYGFGDKGNLYLIILPGVGGSQVTVPDASLISRFGTSPTGYSSGFQSLMDFNPVADAIRLIGNNDENYAIVNMNGGTLNQMVRQTNMSYPPPQPGGFQPLPLDPDITAGAYSNNFVGAATTFFYMIDYHSDSLVTIADLTAGGSSNTAGGKLRGLSQITLANSPAGTPPINFAPTSGFDIYTAANGQNVGIAVTGQNLYCINDLDKIYFGQKRALATEANAKANLGVGAYIDVAVAPF